ncbi:zinc finger CCHC domain-containing protein 9-like [Eucalyptus grandis]|uniref:zinc finger CCHC domain-containing protein 9-like n=1 Tax=Eucalyptus grandis TaxID=71139 RepID=UPI00192EBF79|nr:zinc finger CCHC domain-containing protein 9-like [Eucalyptus grandis]
MCTKAEKVVLAAYQLRGIAATWWKANKGIVFPEGVAPEWNAFLEVFNEKYFSDCARELKMAEFQRLRQGMMTVDEYEAKFVELSQYAPELVQKPADRARRFRDGLRPEVRSFLVPLDLKEYKDLYKRAQLIEKDQNERAVASGLQFNSNREGNRFGKRPMFGGRYPVPLNMKGGIGKPSPNHHGVCRSCGRQHDSAPCPSRIGACYECGQQGYISRNCPRNQMG